MSIWAAIVDWLKAEGTKEAGKEILKQGIAGEAGKTGVGTGSGGDLMSAILGSMGKGEGKGTAKDIAAQESTKAVGKEVTGKGIIGTAAKEGAKAGAKVIPEIGKFLLDQTPPGQLYQLYKRLTSPQQTGGGLIQSQTNRAQPPMGGALPQQQQLPQQPSIPEQYQGMGNAVAPQQQTATLPDPNQQVGWMRGFIDALTGQPQPEALGDKGLRQGRKTAYYGGGVIPNILMSKLGQPSPAESTAYQQATQQREEKSKRESVVYKTEEDIPREIAGKELVRVEPVEGGFMGVWYDRAQAGEKDKSAMDIFKDEEKIKNGEYEINEIYYDAQGIKRRFLGNNKWSNPL